MSYTEGHTPREPWNNTFCFKSLKRTSINGLTDGTTDGPIDRRTDESTDQINRRTEEPADRSNQEIHGITY